MSDIQVTPAAVAVPAVTETVPTPVAETAPAVPAKVAPISEPAVASTEPVIPATAVPVADETAPVAAATEAEPKPVEPINEGVLGYKAPGLLKQFTFAKKDFWFSDEPVAASSLDLYLRGEKDEISHPVVAWASQTGKGLLFFVKKGETDKSRPAGVLPLYDAVDLKKSSPQEFTFRLYNQQHSFKASSDVERDGWYISIEKSIELGKAARESVLESETHKAELQKLVDAASVPPAATSTVMTAGGFPVANTATARRKSTELDMIEGAKPATSDDDEEDLKKNDKSRSSSRGVLARLMGKKEELETKVEEKKEEHEEKKQEKEIEKAAKHEDKKDETAEVAAVGAGTGAIVAADEKPKPTKRGSIFGSLKAGFKSPVKEKEFKDAELKPEGAVTETAPRLPETAAVVAPEISEPAVEAPVAAGLTEPKTEIETPKEAEVLTPAREKKSFLSGIGFLNKRDRSVSPSPAVKDATPAPAAAASPAAETVEPIPFIDINTIAPETAAAPGTAVDTTETVDKVEEPSQVNRRSSVFGGLGRRASKMIQRVQSSKKETAATTPAAENQVDEAPITAPVVENDLAAHEATEPILEENKLHSAPVVAASA